MTDLNPVDAMTTDYRAMCAELVDLLDCFSSTFNIPIETSVVTRARALLAQPVAEGPTIAELWELYEEMADEPGDWAWVRDYALAALAKWGHPTPQPVAVSERLPGPDDCLDEGWAWFFNQRIGWRQAVLPVSPGYTHWLPAHALPTPEATTD